MATTATYTVPASAKDGDEIKLTVTDKDGDTASDTVYVGGLTILKVEPLAQGTTYKYVKAYFSKALTSLAPSEIEIRGKKDQKLYSIQTATLSTDGMAADLTLYGNNDSDLTTFLWPNTTYVMTLTQNGQSTSLEFELPAYMTDKIVTAVDMENNKISVTCSGKTGETGLIWVDRNNNDQYDAGEELGAVEEFNVAGKYTGNLGSLIGRTVNFQYDTDNNLTAFSLDEADVVYGAMQYVNDIGGLKNGYYKDKITGTKYKNSATSSSTKNTTKVFKAYDGTYVDDEATLALVNPLDNTTFQYVKLVLNPDGTVSTANVLENLDISLFVTEVDGTKAIQDKNNGVDLDGYTIVKDDEYVKPADLEIGDVVFVNANTGVKFADVYNNEVSGEISNVISGKLDIDEKTYSWNGAQYYDEGDDVYKKLKTGDDDEKSQNYLNSLDTEVDTTIWLNRKGDIVYLDGTETGVVNTTDVTYLVVEPGKSYTESLKPYIQVKVFNGDELETLAIPVSGLKYYNGNSGKFTPAANWATNTNAELAFVSDPAVAGGNLVTGSDSIGTDILPAGELMVVTYNDEGTAIGIKAHQSIDVTTGTIDNQHTLKGAKSPNLSKDTAVVTTTVAATTDHKWSTGSYTNLWIWDYQGTIPTADLTDDKFTMVALTDFANEIITDDSAAAADFTSLAYRADGTKATDLVVILADDGAYKANDTNDIYGMLTGTTKKNNSDNTKQVIKTITILGLDGTKAVYEGNGTLEPTDITAKEGDFVKLTQDKVTEKIKDVAIEEQWDYKTPDNALGKLAANREYDSEKLVLSDGTELTYAEGGSILLRYTEEGSVKHKVVTYSDVNTIKQEMDVWYDNTFIDSTGKKIQSAMIVVQTVGTPQAAYVTLNDIAGAVKFATGTIGTANVLDTSDSDTVTYTLKQLKPGDTSATTAGTLTVAGTALKTSADIALHAGYSYWVAIDTDNNGDYSDATSNVVVADAAVIATATAATNAVAFTTTTGVTATTSAITIKDQFNDTITSGFTVSATSPANSTANTAETSSGAGDGDKVTTSDWAYDGTTGFATWSNTYSADGGAADTTSAFEITRTGSTKKVTVTVTWTNCTAAAAAATYGVTVA